MFIFQDGEINMTFKKAIIIREIKQNAMILFNPYNNNNDFIVKMYTFISYFQIALPIKVQAIPSFSYYYIFPLIVSHIQ